MKRWSMLGPDVAEVMVSGPGSAESPSEAVSAPTRLCHSLDFLP